VRLCREVDDDLDRVLAQRRLGQLAVADVPLDERDSLLDRGEAGPIARVGEQVVDDDVIVRVPLEQVVDEVRADEARSAGHEEAHRAEG
jgi:hypothetical protein